MAVPNQNLDEIETTANIFIERNSGRDRLIFVLKNGSIIEGKVIRHNPQHAPTFAVLKVEKISGIKVTGSLILKISDIVCWGSE